MSPPVKENKLDGSIPRPANEGPTTCEMPEAAGALAAGVREIETACAILKHEADSSSELIAMVYCMRDVECLTNKTKVMQGKQEATGKQPLLYGIQYRKAQESKRGDGRLQKWPPSVQPSNNQDRV